MTVDFIPDWSQTWTPEQAEKELKDFKFEGPGWYVQKSGETLLVTPLGRQPKECWRQKSLRYEAFRFHSYSFNPSGDFNLIANAPTRQDDRE